MTTSRGRLLAGALLPIALATGCGGSQSATQEVALDDAFAAASEATSYRVTSWTAQDLSSPLMGVDSETTIDQARPTERAEVTPDLTHIALDLSALLGAMMGEGPQLGLEMWASPDRITIDTRDYAVIADVDPTTDLGPLEPGIAFVDLDAFSRDGEDVAELMTGQGVVDLRTLATDLPSILEDVEQEGSTITGTAGYADLVEALGGDVEQVSRGAAAGLALNLGVDVDELTDLYVDFYTATPTDVTVTLDSDESLSSVEYTVDLSGIHTAVFARPELFDSPPGAAELEEVRDLAGKTEWTMTVLTRFEIDEDLTPEPAPDTDDDRTDEWVTFLEGARS